jgi:hypothetical protein
MSEDRATVIVRDIVEVLVRGIVEAIAADLRSRVLNKEGLVSPKLMQVLVDLVRDELEGVGEWKTLGEAAQRVVDRVDPAGEEDV